MIVPTMKRDEQLISFDICFVYLKILTNSPEEREATARNTAKVPEQKKRHVDCSNHKLE